MMRYAWLAIVALATSCSSREAARMTSRPLSASAAGRSTEWRTYNDTLTGDRFAAGVDLTPAMARRLAPVCVYDTGKAISAQTGPIIVAGTMYFTNEDTTYAIDPATCRPRWEQTRTIEPKRAMRNNRGVAYLDGRLFRGFGDGHVVALDAASGRQLWDVQIAEPERGESLPMAPVAHGGLVFFGIAGGDNFGMTGRVYALRTSDGSTVWRFDTVPDTKEVRATWPKASAQNPPTGGGMWTTFSLEPTTGVLYVSAGNAAPDFVLELRPGRSLYTNSVLGLSTRDGSIVGYVQPIGRDEHDHDVAAAPALITTRGGRQLAVTPAKNGRAYAIDRKDFSILYSVDTTTRENLETHLNTRTPVRFCPGTQGGSEWNGAAYSPKLNLVYVGAVDWCTTIQLQPTEQLLASGRPGVPWSGALDHEHQFGQMDPIDRWAGWVTAFDADTGKVAWKYKAPAPVLGGVTVTEGGVVLTGDLRGAFRAFDARTGRVVLERRLGNAIGGGIIAYAIAGQPYVAVVTGQPSPIWPVDRNETAKVMVLSTQQRSQP